MLAIYTAEFKAAGLFPILYPQMMEQLNCITMIVQEEHIREQIDFFTILQS